MNALKALVAVMGALIVGLMMVLGYGLYRKAADPDFRFFDLGGGTTETARPVGTTETARPVGTTETARPVGTPAPAVTAQSLGLPPTATVRTIEADSGRLFIHVRLADGTERVFVVDAASGAVTATINVNR